MSLFLAQLLVGLALLLLGGALVADTTLIRAGLRALPRSAPAAYVLFGAAAAWFVLLVLNMSDADLIVPAPKATTRPPSPCSPCSPFLMSLSSSPCVASRP